MHYHPGRPLPVLSHGRCIVYHSMPQHIETEAQPKYSDNQTLCSDDAILNVETSPNPTLFFSGPGIVGKWTDLAGLLASIMLMHPKFPLTRQGLGQPWDRCVCSIWEGLGSGGLSFWAEDLARSGIWWLFFWAQDLASSGIW